MEYDEFDREEEQGITLAQIFAVLFGRKITLFSVWAGVFILGVLVLELVIVPRQKVYSSKFQFTSTVADTETFSDGQDINIYELVSLQNVIGVANEAGISEKTAKSIYYSSYFKIEKVKEVNEKTNEIVNSYFYLELPTTPFKNLNQARSFVQGIANLPNLGEQFILSNQVNTQYLSLYSQATTFDAQVTYLQNQVDLLNTRYTALISTYGDEFIANGNKLSDEMTEINEYFTINSLSELSNQIRVNGYVKGNSNEKDKYQAQIDTLVREKNVVQLKLDDLKTQRDDLITTASGTVQSLELTEYNTQIIELTLRIRDIDEEVEILQKKIDNLDKVSTDADLQAAIGELEALLEVYKTKLDDFTSDYNEQAVYVAENNSLTYFTSSSIVEETGSLGLIKVVLYPLVAGFFVALIVNLFIDGKKLTKKYKLVPIYMIKDDPKKEESEEENDENKTA